MPSLLTSEIQLPMPGPDAGIGVQRALSETAFAAFTTTFLPFQRENSGQPEERVLGSLAPQTIEGAIGQETIPTAPNRIPAREQQSGWKHKALGAVGVLAAGAALAGTAGASNGESSGGGHHHGGGWAAAHCFTRAEKAYTASMPHDSIAATKRATRCAVIAVWGSGEWYPARKLYTKESSFRDGVVNHIGACGIGQAYHCSKIGHHGNRSLESQLKWNFRYVKEVYGDFWNAWSHDKADNSY